MYSRLFIIKCFADIVYISTQFNLLPFFLGGVELPNKARGQDLFPVQLVLSTGLWFFRCKARHFGHKKSGRVNQPF